MVEEESCSCEVEAGEIVLARKASLRALGRKESRLHLLEAPFGAVFAREKSVSAHPRSHMGLSQEEKLAFLPSSQSPVVVVRDSRLRFS